MCCACVFYEALVELRPTCYGEKRKKEKEKDGKGDFVEKKKKKKVKKTLEEEKKKTLRTANNSVF